MKKLLSMLLAVMMILSSVSFAAPVPADVVTSVTEEAQTTQETQPSQTPLTEEANLQAEVDYGTLIASIDFDDLESGKIANNKDVSAIGTVNLPEGFEDVNLQLYRHSSCTLEVTTETDENGDVVGKYGLYTVPVDAGWPKLGFVSITAMPHGSYTLTADITPLTVGENAATERKNWTTSAFLAAPDTAAWIDESNYQTYKNNSSYADETTLTHNFAVTYNLLKTGSYDTDKSAAAYPFTGVTGVHAMLGVNANAHETLTYKFDNLKLYYKAPYEITFDANGVEGVQLPTSEYFDCEKQETVTENKVWITAGGSFKPSDYKLANTHEKLFAGWMDENGNTVWNSITPTGDMKLTARWEDAYDDTYGQLIASIDFEKFALGDAVSKVNAADYGVVSDNLPAGFPAKIMFSQTYGNSVIEGTEDDKYITTYGDGRYSRIQFSTETESANDLFPEGKYTLIWDLKLDTERSVDVQSINLGEQNIYWWNGKKYSEVNNGFNEDKSTVRITEGNKTGWNHSIGARSVLYGETITLNDGSKITFAGAGAFQAMPSVTRTDGASTHMVYIHFDNMKLYYRPPVTISFKDPIGYSADALPETTKYKYGTNVTFPTLTTDKPNARFMGWSYEKDGVVLKQTSINAEKDTTLYAVWAIAEDHPEYGKVLFNLDFENANDFSSNALKNFGYVNADDANAVNWGMGNSQIKTNSLAIYTVNKDGQIIYKNGVKVEDESITDYTPANRFLGFNGANNTHPQISPYAGADAGQYNFADKGYFTLSADGAVRVGENSVNKPKTDVFTYQFRPTSYGTAESGATLITQDRTINFDSKSKIDLSTGSWNNRTAITKELINHVGEKITKNNVTYTFNEVTSIRKILIHFQYPSWASYKNADNTYTTNGNEDLFMVDNMVLYWKPFTANLTIDMNGFDAFTIDGFTDKSTKEIVDVSALTDEYIGKNFNGKTLLGLSYEPDGEFVTEDFYLTKDTTLYVIWEEGYIGSVPAISTKNSIRTDSKSGIRFMANVLNAQRSIAEEYGFIVTRSTILERLGLADTDLTFKMDEGTYAYGASYIKDTDVDFRYAVDEENDVTYFTGVFTGMPRYKEYLTEEVVARPYIRYEDGKTYYGQPHSRSVVDVAKEIRDSGYMVNGVSMTETEIETIKDILRVCGEKEDDLTLFYIDGDYGNAYNVTSANVSVVDDPVNSGRGKVLYVGTKATPAAPESWNYFQVKKCGYEAGKTYHVTCEVLAYETDAIGNSISNETTQIDHVGTCLINSNFLYGVVGVDGTANHTGCDSGTRSVNAKTNAWSKIDFYYTVDENFDPSKEYYIGFYVDPRKYTDAAAIEYKAYRPATEAELSANKADLDVDGDGTKESKKYQVARSFYIDNFKVVEVVK